MDSLKLLLSEENSKRVCLLCFYDSDNVLGIDDCMEILDGNSSDCTTLRNITNSLFPSYDILADQACQLCSKLIIEMYTSIKRGLAKIKLIKVLTERIYKEPKPTSAPSNEVTNKLMNITNNSTDDTKKNLELSRKTFKSHVCDVCGNSYKNSTKLKLHLNSHAQTQCSFCKEMVERSVLKSHLRRHSKSVSRAVKRVSFKCSHCDYTTANKQDLKSHINKLHLNVRPYICEQCQKGFFSKKNLKEHILTHEKNKTMICDVCGEQYSYKKTLEIHIMRSHINCRPYDCEQCGQQFVTCSQKNEHKKRKHSKNEFGCSLCDKKYSFRRELTRHVKLIHDKAISRTPQ